MENTCTFNSLYLLGEFTNQYKGRHTNRFYDISFFFYLQIIALYTYVNGKISPILPGGFFFDVVNNEIVGAKPYEDSYQLPAPLRNARFIPLECIFLTGKTFFDALANVFLTAYPGKSAA